MNMRIQTYDNSKTANQALKDGLNSLVEICEYTEKEFDKAYQEYKSKS